MRFPKMKSPRTVRQRVEVFGGFDARPRIPDGALAYTENLTSDAYPLLSPRSSRGVYCGEDERPVRGIVANQGIHVLRDRTLVLSDGQAAEPEFSVADKTMVSMGARVAVFPDKKWVNIAACLAKDENLPTWGQLEGDKTLWGVMSYAALPDGRYFPEGEVLTSQPETPRDGQYWRDYTVFPAVLKRWYASSHMWVEEAINYARLEADTIAQGFKVGDMVKITGSYEGALELPEYTRIVWVSEDNNAMVVEGFVIKHQANVANLEPLQISRPIPDMDLVIAAGNRLWGCKFGVTEDGPINEIYASKLGDMENWHSFQGISTDSYVVSIGEDGPFTGAVCYEDRPIFFKAGCMIEILGSYPEQFRTRVTRCDGVAPGCEKSLAVVDNVLYYKSVSGFCAYDGSMPVPVGKALGDKRYTAAVATGCGSKYYVSMRQEDTDTWHFFVYDTQRSLWHREDDLQARWLCSYGDQVYCVPANRGKVLTLRGEGDGEPVTWAAETGDLCLELTDSKYITRLDLRLALEQDSTVTVRLRYDDAVDWEDVYTLRGLGMQSVVLPILPRRCDRLRLRLEGVGAAKIHSITRTIEQGGDPQWT